MENKPEYEFMIDLLRLLNYWTKAVNPEKQASGLAFSICCLFDGSTVKDKAYRVLYGKTEQTISHDEFCDMEARLEHIDRLDTNPPIDFSCLGSGPFVALPPRDEQEVAK